MQVRELDTKAAPNKWFAMRDARMRNYANSSFFSEEKKVKAESMKQVLELVYFAKKVHVNYRKNFIAVKVEGARVKDAKNLRFIEAEWQKEGIIKCVTDQGVVYRLAR
jgi:hypothetical protein